MDIQSTTEVGVGVGDVLLLGVVLLVFEVVSVLFVFWIEICMAKAVEKRSSRKSTGESLLYFSIMH